MSFRERASTIPIAVYTGFVCWQCHTWDVRMYAVACGTRMWGPSVCANASGCNSVLEARIHMWVANVHVCGRCQIWSACVPAIVCVAHA